MNPEVIIPVCASIDYRKYFGNKVRCLKDGEVFQA